MQKYWHSYDKRLHHKGFSLLEAKQITKWDHKKMFRKTAINSLSCTHLKKNTVLPFRPFAASFSASKLVSTSRTSIHSCVSRRMLSFPMTKIQFLMLNQDHPSSNRSMVNCPMKNRLLSKIVKRLKSNQHVIHKNLKQWKFPTYPHMFSLFESQYRISPVSYVGGQNFDFPALIHEQYQAIRRQLRFEKENYLNTFMN